MQFFQKLSLQKKQTFIILVTSGIALLMACIIFVTYDVVTFRRAMVSNVSTLAEIVGNNSIAALDFDDAKSAQETLSALRAEPNIESGCIYTKDGKIFASYNRVDDEIKIFPPSTESDRHYFKDHSLHLFRKIKNKDEIIGTVYVESDLEALYARLQRYAIIVTGVFLLALLAALFLSTRLQKLISGPILNLVQTTRAVAREQNFSMRAVKRSEDELGTLVDSFNEMLSEIQSRDVALQKSKDVLEDRVKERTHELQRTEELYRRAIAGADAVPYSYDYRMRSYLFIGEGIEQLIGYATHEVTPLLWESIIQETIMAGETTGLAKDEAARRVKTGEIRNWRCDMRIKTRDGKSRWLSDTSVQNIDEAGKPTGSMGILQDITERKQAEISALAFSKMGQNLGSAASPEDAARTISEVADDLLGWDACWVLLYSEKDDLTYSIFNADTFDGKRVPNSPITAAKPTVLQRRILTSGAELILRDNPTSPLPGAVPFGNTSRMSASLMFVPIRSGSRIVGILSVQSYASRAYNQQNLTALQTLADQCGGALERIWAGEALRKSESQFRLVWNISAEGMRLANFDGTVLMVNDAYCQMVGKSKEEVEGKPLSIIHSEENQEYIQQKHHEEISERSFHPHLEKQVKLWNGKKVWFGLSNSILELPGQPPLLLSVFRDITQRKKDEAEMNILHNQLLDASRQAGMADVATNVLHNVGNVLNSVNVSGSVIRDKIKKSKGANLSKVAGLLQEQGDNLSGFFASDPKGKQLPGYLAQLATHLAGEQEEVLREISSLVSNIEHIKEIVTMQQSYAKVSGMSESLQLIDLVEDALRMNAGALNRHQVQIVREYSEVPPITTEKHKVLQILVNLVRNAKYACDDANRDDKQITMRVTNDDNKVRIAVIDNGIGIPTENLTRIFAHGFTTRKNGHGFGLHSGALAAKEIGGSLNVQSGGIGHGAEFTLELPRI